MYRSCSVCGGIHQEDKMCKRVYKKNTKESQFRNTNAWIKKRNQIKKKQEKFCKYQKQTKQKCQTVGIKDIKKIWIK